VTNVLLRGCQHENNLSTKANHSQEVHQRKIGLLRFSSLLPLISDTLYFNSGLLNSRRSVSSHHEVLFLRHAAHPSDGQGDDSLKFMSRKPPLS